MQRTLLKLQFQVFWWFLEYHGISNSSIISGVLSENKKLKRQKQSIYPYRVSCWRCTSACVHVWHSTEKRKPAERLLLVPQSHERFRASQQSRASTVQTRSPSQFLALPVFCRYMIHTCTAQLNNGRQQTENEKTMQRIVPLPLQSMIGSKVLYQGQPPASWDSGRDFFIAKVWQICSGCLKKRGKSRHSFGN